MGNTVNYILTSEDYFDIIDFDSKSPKEKVAYMLYYVTKIARLRKDMTPKILSDRIADQYKMYLIRTHNTKNGEKYIPLKYQDVKTVIEKNPDYFEPVTTGIRDYSDRNSRDVAYVLSKIKLAELDNEFDKNIKRLFNGTRKKALFEKFSYTLILLLVALSSVIYIKMLNLKKTDMSHLSVKQYADIMDFSSSNDTQKAIYLLYYVTKLNELKQSMSTKVICDRLADNGYPGINANLLENKFVKSTHIVESSTFPNTFELSESGLEIVEARFISRMNKRNVIEIDKSFALPIISIVLSVIGLTFKTGYTLGKSEQ